MASEEKNSLDRVLANQKRRSSRYFPTRIEGPAASTSEAAFDIDTPVDLAALQITELAGPRWPVTSERRLG